ncbi:thioredoxin family protein, partial [Bacillus subtilis]
MIKLESDGHLRSLLEEDVILLFSANWCPDCRVIEPVLPEIEDKFSEWTFVYVDR